MAVDKAQAFAYFKQAAEGGHADAMCSLGSLYFQGEGCGRDLAAAFHWYQQAAETGREDGTPHREAWLNLASMCVRQPLRNPLICRTSIPPSTPGQVLTAAVWFGRHANGDFVPKNTEVAKQILRFLESTSPAPGLPAARPEA